MTRLCRRFRVIGSSVAAYSREKPHKEGLRRRGSPTVAAPLLAHGAGARCRTCETRAGVVHCGSRAILPTVPDPNEVTEDLRGQPLGRLRAAPGWQHHLSNPRSDFAHRQRALAARFLAILRFRHRVALAFQQELWRSAVTVTTLRLGKIGDLRQAESAFRGLAERFCSLCRGRNAN